MTRLQFEVASAKKPNLNFCGSDLDDDDTSADGDNIVIKLKEQLAIKDEMLNEAVIEYHNKMEETNKMQQEKDLLNKEMIKATAAISDLQVEFYIVFYVCQIKKIILIYLIGSTGAKQPSS